MASASTRLVTGSGAVLLKTSEIFHSQGPLRHRDPVIDVYHNTSCRPVATGPPTKNLNGRLIFSSTPPFGASTMPVRMMTSRAPAPTRDAPQLPSHTGVTQEVVSGRERLVEELIVECRAVESHGRSLNEDSRLA